VLSKEIARCWTINRY